MEEQAPQQLQEPSQKPQEPLQQQELHKILRQLKILNFWIAFFGVLIITVLVIFGILVYQLVTFVQTTNNQLKTLQQNTTQTLDVKSQLCDSPLLKDTSACKGE